MEEKSLSDRVSEHQGKVALGLGGAAGLASYFALRRRTPGLIHKKFKRHLEPFMDVADYGRRGMIAKVQAVAEQPFKTDIMRAPRRGLKGFDPKKHLYLGRRFDFQRMTAKRFPKRGITAHTWKYEPEDMDDKFIHAKKLGEKYAPKTWRLSKPEALKIKKLHTGKEVLQYLKKKHGDNFVYKGRTSEAIGQGTGKAQLIHPKTKPTSKFLNYFRKHPEAHVGQEKLDILKEYRITSVGDKVVTVQDRFAHPLMTKVLKKLDKGAHSPFPILPLPRLTNRKIYSEAEKILRHHNKKFGIRKLDILNMDLALIRGPRGKKSFKVIEPNYGPSGGQMDNPLISHKVYKALTGKETSLKAAAKATGAGLASGVGSYALINKAKKDGE